MIATRGDALAALGLEPDRANERSAIVSAFERLARRYPAQSFPEKFERLLLARDFLMEPTKIWQEFVRSRTVDLSWVGPYLGKQNPENPAKGHTEVLQAMLRATFIANPLGGDGALDGMPNEFQDLIEEMLGMGKRRGRREIPF